MQGCRVSCCAMLICLAGEGGAASPPGQARLPGEIGTALRAEPASLPASLRAQGSGARSGSWSEWPADAVARSARPDRGNRRRAEGHGAFGAGPAGVNALDHPHPYGFADVPCPACARAPARWQEEPARSRALLGALLWLGSFLWLWPAALRRRARRLGQAPPITGGRIGGASRQVA